MSVNLRKNIIDFTLGADPEFACLDKNNQVICARDVCGGNAGSAEFGADGHANTFEIRPKPSKSPLQLAANIRKIFMDKIDEKPNFLKWKWLAGSHQAGMPLGGHIHFGIKSDIISPSFGSQILSQYLGTLNMCIEDAKQAKDRRRQYGGAEDHRAQDWGFEYRSLGSWLTSPYITRAHLCLAKIVIWELVNNRAFRPGLYVNDLDMRQMNTKHVLESFETIWEDITKMHLYPQYKQYVDLFHFLITNKRTWFPKGDMRASWGLVDLRAINSEGLTLDSVWSSYLQNNVRTNRVVPVENIIS